MEPPKPYVLSGAMIGSPDGAAFRHSRIGAHWRCEIKTRNPQQLEGPNPTFAPSVQKKVGAQRCQSKTLTRPVPPSGQEGQAKPIVGGVDVNAIGQVSPQHGRGRSLRETHNNPPAAGGVAFGSGGCMPRQDLGEF